MKRHNRRGCALESLEHRLLFFTYQVTGTNGNDAISISIDEANNRIISAVNGISDSAVDSLNDNIEISGLGGNDTISITETGDNTVVVFAGAGDDTINVGNGANNLNTAASAVTVNGEGNTDTVVLFDQNNTVNSEFLVLTGNRIDRSTMSPVTVNAESLLLHTSTTAAVGLTMTAQPTFSTTFDANGVANSVVRFEGTGGEPGVYAPSGTTPGSGTASMGVANVDFNQCTIVQYTNFALVTMRTPNANDVLSWTAPGFTSITGTSGGVAITKLEVDADTLALDLLTNDAGAGNDSITSSTGNGSFGLLRVGFGTGTNTLNANGGNWNVTCFGIGGLNLDCSINNANVTFTDTQTIASVTLNNSTVSVGGTSAHLEIEELAVDTGTSNLTAGSGNEINITTQFTMATGRTLNKTGNGTLNIDADQLFAGAVFFNAKGGVTNFNTDCGTPGAKRLNLLADTGDIVLNSNQHLASLSNQFGDVIVTADGNRVVWADSITVGGEGGIINLNDNDMLLDYTSAADATAFRSILHSGRNNGAWNGAGINSASAAANPGHLTTLATMEATDFKSIYGAGAKFHGTPIDNTAVLVKYTWYGDTDFNGKVDGADYARLDAKFNQQSSQGNIGGFINGDFDDNGKIDGADYALIDAAFNGQNATLRPARGQLPSRSAK